MFFALLLGVEEGGFCAAVKSYLGIIVSELSSCTLSACADMLADKWEAEVIFRGAICSFMEKIVSLRHI